MAVIEQEVLSDEGQEMNINATEGHSEAGPVWSIETRVKIPEGVAEQGAQAVIDYIIDLLDNADDDVTFKICAKEKDTTDPNFAPDWIYEDSIDTDGLIMLFRKRGRSPDIIFSDDQCGDETSEDFDYIALPGEELITTDERDSIPSGEWRVRRPLRHGMTMVHRDPAEKDEQKILILDAVYENWGPGYHRSRATISYKIIDGDRAGEEVTSHQISDFDHFKLDVSEPQPVQEAS